MIYRNPSIHSMKLRDFLPEWRPEISAQERNRCSDRFHKKTLREESCCCASLPLWQSTVVTWILSAICFRSCFRVLSKVSVSSKETHITKDLCQDASETDNLISYQESSHKFFTKLPTSHEFCSGFVSIFAAVPGPAVLISWPHCCSVLERSWATACWAWCPC